jgi:chromosome segregation protein
MRLRKLILHGFKSFADRTEFRFDQPVTCIVGPNGCGKSNVVDATKWVLGEQSAKSLRGDAMLDVIFNGSGNRKPAGMAEVVLVFENPPGADGVRVLNLPSDEVAVGRRLYRDGTSEYTLNGHTSRLKDVRDLFLDTGVGVDAYSVIEQGRVAQLLESNPQQRRIIFEEAAGISRFKAKKKESQRKLEKVDQNLLRVTDVVNEVDRRLRSVKVQAGRRPHVPGIHHPPERTAARLRAAGISQAARRERPRRRRDRGDSFRVDDVAGDLGQAAERAGDRPRRGRGPAGGQAAGRARARRSAAAVRAAKQAQHYAEQQLAQIAEQAEQLGRDRQRAEEQRAEAEAHAAAEAESLEALTIELDAKREEIAEKGESFKAGQLRLNDLVNQIEKNKQAVLDQMRKLAQVNSRLASIEIERKNIASLQQRQGDRRRQVVEGVEAAEALAGEIKAKLETTLAQIAERQAEQEARKTAAAALGQQIRAVTEQLGSAKEHRSALLSRQKLLQDLEARREGVSDAVKKVLKERDQKFPFVSGIVADLLRVDVEHATVIEAALDGRDQWLVGESHEAIQAGEASLGALSGRVSFVARERGVGVSPTPQGSVEATSAYDWNQHPQGVRLAIDLVRYEQADAAIAETLLGHTAIVDTLDDALALHAAGPAGWRYITKTRSLSRPTARSRPGRSARAWACCRGGRSSTRSRCR